MIATKSFSPTLSFLQKDEASWDNFNSELLNSGVLESLILEYEYGNGKLQHIHLAPDTLIFHDEKNGQFQVGYELSEYSLCAAIDYTTTYHMFVSFSKTENDEIVLTGEERNERSDEL